MQIEKLHIKQSQTTFKGIIPGWEARCLGKITLDVVFGTPKNYRFEVVTFHIVPFQSGYHALLGCSTFSKFQAVLHYGYKKLKMSGPNGIITISSNPSKALKIKNKTASLALESLPEALTA